MKRFTLPQICDCGARGSITLEPGPRPAPGQEDPDPAIVAAEGLFGLDGRGGVRCLSCGDQFGWQTA